MPLSNTLIAQRNQFNRVRTNLINIENQLATAIERVRNADSNVASNFSIDSNRADNNSINHCLNRLISLRNSINSSMVPSVDREINRLNGRIQTQLSIESEANNA